MKKFTSLFIVLCIMVAWCTPFAGAISVEEATATVEVLNYSGRLSDEDAEKLKECVSATVFLADDEAIPLDCTITVRDVAHNSRNLYSTGGQTYAITVSAQQKETGPMENSTNTNSVVATATITMIWTDVFGTANTIDNLSGGVEITKGTFKSGKVSYGRSHTRPIPQRYFQTGTSFNKDISYTSSGLNGSLHVHLQVWFKEWDDTSYLIVCVEPTIFD